MAAQPPLERTHCRPPAFGVLSPLTTLGLACKGVRSILQGALDGSSEDAFARSLGVSSRHLRRIFMAELGISPARLARAVRARSGLRLLQETDLSVTDVARLANFGSLRQFERVCRELYDASPRELQARRHDGLRLQLVASPDADAGPRTIDVVIYLERWDQLAHVIRLVRQP